MKPIHRLLLLLYICFFIISCKKNNFTTTIGKTGLVSTDSVSGQTTADPRQYEQGTIIYKNGYVDMPYVLNSVNGTWICVYTTSATGEGSPGETIGISNSSDQGKTWNFITYLEPNSGSAAFYAIPFINANGRMYIFYGYNNDNILSLNGTKLIRSDIVGEMCYKYSDDNGITWSSRQVINMPVTQYDRINNWQGKYSMWWSVCKPILSSDNQMYFSFTKIAQYYLSQEEGWVVNSPNINTEQDISKLVWNFLPVGDIGIRSQNMGLVQEEHNIVQLSNGSFCCVFRTNNGYPAVCYSQDNCQTWSAPVPLYFNDGNLMKNPRACTRIFKFLNGKYLLWFENNYNYNFTYNRNPAWVSGGIESNGVILWSQPEVLLYSQDTTKGFSYPDIFQSGSNYYLTETQKTITRLHVINPNLLNSLWSQGTVKTHSTANLVADLSTGNQTLLTGSNYTYSTSNLGTGLTLNLNLNITSFTSTGQTILSFLSTDKTDTLIKVRSSNKQTVEVDVYNAGQLLTTLYCDVSLIKLNVPLFISISMDPDSRVLSAMVNGILCNSGLHPFRSGWVTVPPSFNFSAISGNVYISAFNGSLNTMQIYNRALTTGDMLSEYLAIK